MTDTPRLLVKVSKKLKTLTFSRGEDKISLDITDGEINIIELDMWVSDILAKETEKYHLQQRLMGK